MLEPWHLRAATLFDDPILLEWGVHHYAKIPPHSELKEQLGEHWFDHLFLKRLIDAAGTDTDTDSLPIVLQDVPAKYFTPFATTIATRWSEWPANLVAPAAHILATVAPELSATTFASYLDKPAPLSGHQVFAILDNLQHLPAPAALKMTETLLQLSRGPAKTILTHIQVNILLAAVECQQHQFLPALLDQILVQPEPQVQGFVNAMVTEWFGNDSFADLYFMYRDDVSVATFQELAVLFENATPLAEIDAVLASTTPLVEALRLLETHQNRSEESTLAWALLQQFSENHELSEVVKNSLAGLALAAVASAFERKTVDVATLGMDDMLTLLAQDVKTNIHYEALNHALRGMPRVELIAATIAHQNKTIDTLGAIALARLMGDLGWPEFVPQLIGCLGEDFGDFLHQAAEKSLLAIGEVARDALIAQWPTLERTQQIYGASVIQGVGGAAAAEFALNGVDDLRHDDVEQWCDFMLAAPDPRMIEVLQSTLHRQQPLIDEAYYCLCRVLGHETPELDKLRVKILLNRQATLKRIKNFEDGHDGFDQRATLNLSLRCTVCKDVNRYEVKQVIMGDSTAHACLLADEFACISCGELVDFEFQADASLAIIGENLRQLGATADGKSPASKLVTLMAVVMADGSSQPLPKAFAQLRENVSRNPADWLSWFRLGNINLGINRPKAALVCFQKAHTLNPRSLEAVINLASALKDAGQDAAAMAIMKSALATRMPWQMLTSNPSSVGPDFAQLFNDLQHSTGQNDAPPVHPQFLGPQSKVGRNDPCPCGSGRKFKKCCI